MRTTRHNAAKTVAARAKAWLLCLSASLCALSTNAASEKTRSLEPVTLQLKWTHAFQFAGYYAALEKGYYRAAGLDVKIVEATPGVDPIRNVIEGRAQFGVGTSSLLLERKAGKPVVALAVIFQHSPYVLIARQEKAGQDIHDLTGKRIMLEPQSDEIVAYLKKEGIPLERFTRVEHSYDPRDLIAGRVAAISGYAINQPYYLDRAHFQYQIYTPRSAGIDFYGDNLFTTERELREHPALVKAFRAASLYGWQYAMAHQEEIVDLILARYSQRNSRDYYLFEARQMEPLMRADLIEIGYMYPGRWRHIADVYADIGMMQPGFDLKGFLYDPNPPPPDLGWLYLGMGLAVLVVVGVSALAIYIHRINLRLHRNAEERRLAEQARLASEQQYRGLFEHMTEGYAYCRMIFENGEGRDFIYLTVNPAFETMTGLRNVTGKKISEVIPHHREDNPLLFAAYARVALTGKPEKTEVFVQALNRWFSISVYRPEQGCFVAVFAVITERKQAELYAELRREVLQILNDPGDALDAIQRVLATLKTRTGFDAVGIRLQDGQDFPYIAQQGFSRDFLLTENTLVEHDADGGVCRDKNGNVSLECTCGLVVSGKTDPSLPLFTRGGSFWINDSSPLLQLPPAQDPRLHPRNRCIQFGYASVALVPIRNDGRIVGLIHINDRRKDCFTLEIVERLEGIASYIGAALMRKQAEAEKAKLEIQSRQLQKAESLGRMAGAIAHHFNNQLMAVMGNLEMAMMHLPRDAEPYASLEASMQAARKAAEVSALMLTYIGQSSGAHELLDLSDVCRQNLALLRAGMPKNMALVADLPAPGPFISGNANQLRQVLTNLVSNAWEAGGGGVRLAVKTASPADIPVTNRFPFGWQPGEPSYACLEIADAGCGIAGGDIEKLFDPFFSTKFTGRGLGLAAVLGIVRTHDGGITVESEPRRGSTFRVFLPLSKQTQAVTAPSATASAAYGPSTPPAQADAVLLAEDDDSVRILTRSMLAQLGYASLEAKNGVEALELFRQRRDEIGCLLCDLNMRGMDGWETLTAIRALRPGLPAILASGYDEARVMAGDHPERPQAFLGKPYNLNSLREALERATGRSA